MVRLASRAIHSANIEVSGGRPGDLTLAGSGGGFGLQGIAERLALLGGEVEAGPVPGGWRVTAAVPAPGNPPVEATREHDPLAS